MKYSKIKKTSGAVRFYHRLFFVLAAVLVQGASAATWPDRPVNLVVGFAPGGGTDIMARSISNALGQISSQPFVVENRPGASGNVSASYVARAKSDGYTFLIAPTSIQTVNPLLFKSDINPSEDLQPIMGIGKMQMYLIARPDIEADSMDAFVKLAKEKGSDMSYASSGTGTAPHLAGEMLNQSADISILHIPYTGSAPALQDVMAGQVDYVLDPGLAFPHIESGKVKLLAVASDDKSPFYPNVPTYPELGIKDASLDIWFGIWAPKDTPADVIKNFTELVSRALKSPKLEESFNTLGALPEPLPTDEFIRLLADEGSVLGRIIKNQNITAD